MWKKIIMATILGLVLGLLIGYWVIPEKKVKIIEYQDKIVTKTDTITKWVTLNRIRYRTKSDTLIKKDTVLIVTHPFIAVKDTVADKDTLNLKYYFPEDVFEVDLRRFPLREKTIIKYITITKEKRIEDAWWIKPSYLLGGIVVGFGLGKF